MRIVIAEDSAVLRAGLAEILTYHGHQVVAAVGDAEELRAAVDDQRPDAVVVDVRMPPGYTDEGLRAAIAIRRDRPKTGVLVFSQYIETRYAADLLGAAPGGGAAGVGYLHRQTRLPQRQGTRRAGLDGRRPLQRHDRRDARHQRTVRRETHREHLQQARPGALGRRPPPGARRPFLPDQEP